MLTFPQYMKKIFLKILRYKKKETFYAYNEYAYEFFRGQYQANTSEALACRQYAERDKGGRWDEAYCQTIGLGYSPQKEINSFRLPYQRD